MVAITWSVDVALTSAGFALKRKDNAKANVMSQMKTMTEMISQNQMRRKIQKLLNYLKSPRSKA